jgi:hypothetical protein
MPIETMEQRIAEQVTTRVAAEQASLEEKIAAAADVRTQAAESGLRDLLSGIAQLCTEAVARMEPPSSAGAEGAPLATDEKEVPGFAQPQKPNKLWRVPLVSSMAVAIGSVIFMQLR